MANQSYFLKGYCEGWACVGHVVEDGEETHIVRKPSGDELQLCASCLSDYRQDYPAPNKACTRRVAGVGKKRTGKAAPRG